MSALSGPQLGLPIQLPDHASFANFHAGPNATALAAVQALAQGASNAPVLLHGPVGSGRSHLLQAAVRETSARATALYLPLALPGFDPALLEGAEHAALVALDDFEQALTTPDLALATLRLMDALRARGGALLIALDRAPDASSAAAPPDLRTRLAACARFALRPLDDADLVRLLQTRAARRGLELPDEVAEFIVRRLPRRVPDLLDALAQLDAAALSAQRRLTIPFASQVLPALAPPAARTAPAR